MPVFKILKLLILPVIVLIGLGVYLKYNDSFSLEFAHSHYAAAQQFYNEHPFQAILIFLSTFIFLIGIAFPGGQIAPYVAGLFFGFPIGVGLIFIIYATGPMITFLLSRHLLGNFIQQRFATQLQTFNEGFAKNGLWYLLIVRHLPMPFFVVNLCMGVIKIKTNTYWIINTLCLMPVGIACVYLGSLLVQLDNPADLFTPQFIAALTCIFALPALVTFILINFIKR